MSDNNNGIKNKKNIAKKSSALQRNLLRRKGKLNNGCYQLGKSWPHTPEQVEDNSKDK